VRKESPVSHLPQKPDFGAIEAKARQSAERRNFILALIGNLVYTWSNNESMFIYVLMLLLKTDEVSATVVFATLNTTRARIDLIERLAKIRISDRAIAKNLDRITDRFNELTKIRNEFNHCLYAVDDLGEITDTQSIRLQEVRGNLQLGVPRKMDETRINEMLSAIRGLTRLNREIWDFLPRLKNHLDEVNHPNPQSEGAMSR
jgi:hypothetical protein